MRQIILDTETTGLSPREGHRIIEIGCVEMIDRQLTGNHFHQYINPQREMDAGAFAVHGISNEFLKDKPLFKDVADDFIEYVRGAELIIHNAPFDVGFLNHEFRLAPKSYQTIDDYCSVLDTLRFARRKHPGQRNSLDALCKRYHVDNGHRDLHGALMDSELLALVYLAMTGGQTNLFGGVVEEVKQAGKTAGSKKIIEREGRLPVIPATEEELQAHQERVSAIKEESGVDLWG